MNQQRRRESIYGPARADTVRRGSLVQSLLVQEPKSLKTVKLHDVEASFDIEMLMLDG